MKGVRAYDVLMAGKLYPGQAGPSVGLETFQKGIKGLPVFLVDEAVPCFSAMADAKGGMVPIDDLPPLAVPYPQFIVEWQVEGEPKELWERMCMVCWWTGYISSAGGKKVGILRQSSVACGLVGPNRVPVLSFDCEFKTPIDEDGFAYPSDWAVSPHVKDRQGLTSRSGITLFALALMSAKNVQQVERQLPRNIRRHPGPFAGTASDLHYTLEIPGAKALTEYMAGPGDAAQKRLHLVRGHFADYTEGGGLFGKLHGKYYIAPHVRGSAERGTITKDYRVVAKA